MLALSQSVAVLFLVLLLCPAPAFGLRPDEVLVLANKNASSSLDLAEYYMEKREIPRNHLLKLQVPEGEQCTREDYETKIAGPVRKYLERRSMKGKIRCLLIMYGLPLKIGAPEMNEEERREYRRLQQREKELKTRVSGQGGGRKEQQEEKRRELARVRKRLETVSKAEQRASLDSEIALVLQPNHPLAGWIPNPFFAGFHQRRLMEKRDTTLLVSRLDGPTPEIVRRVIDDSLATERSGLKGKAYFDARWPRSQEKTGFKGKSGYQFYDTSIYAAADLVKKAGIMPVIVNAKPEVFQPGQCPHAALYCGWYSLGRYVDAFSWTRGSVGYHIASAECRTLKDPAAGSGARECSKRGSLPRSGR